VQRARSQVALDPAPRDVLDDEPLEAAGVEQAAVAEAAGRRRRRFAPEQLDVVARQQVARPRPISSSMRSARQASIRRRPAPAGSSIVEARKAALIAPTLVPVTMSIGTWRPSRRARSVRRYWMMPAS
jgi:hypothetical protein